ncbi:hypothetical protein PIB30_030604 [Stylosanthes scabra]|uniref:Uncharacterized protein n=1 Tax=Stylosanthes scabra TaxID=79078 RepID=A0ABU6VAJ1_9FABA|nr:hypothetical protein [Stylosanthes scabra]
MTLIGDPPWRKRLRCSPAQLDNNVTIDISDAEDDSIVLDKHESGLSQASQSSGPTISRGESIVNHQLRTKLRRPQLAGVSGLQGERSLPIRSQCNQMEKSRYYNIMMKAFRHKFKPCAKMQLKKCQIEACAYAFCASIKVSEETMIIVDDTIVTREEIACLLPGKHISDKIMKLVAMKAT